MWEIIFYEKENGRYPAKDFINELNPKNDIPFIMHRLRQLQELGNKLLRPDADYLTDGIYELRIETRNGQFRLLYFFDKQKIIITNGLIKKSRKVPVTDIVTAKEYKKKYYERNQK